ncbi:MAG TPA: S1 RNA-binding domain-containing protein, partial [Terracidiphilus sp.]|nr:S1 RNA-binding domain-containing protein [Terracidiphilus sp.]
MTEETPQDPLPTPDAAKPSALEAPLSTPPAEPLEPSKTGPAPKAAAEPAEPTPAEPEESFADALSAFERSHTHRAESGAKQGAKQLEGTVVSMTPEQVFLDIGYKIEGVLPRSAFPNNAEAVKHGDTVPVSITGRNEEGYYELSRFRVAQPRDW